MSDSCFIVGGGPTLSNFDYRLLDNKNVIAVNQAIFQLPFAKWFCTMDYTWLEKSGASSDPSRQKQFTSHPAEKIFVLAFGGERLKEIDDRHFMDLKYGMLYDLSYFDRVVRAFRYGGVGKTFDEFCCGSDSGYSALQLAVILGYTNIYLLGFDFCTLGTATHCHTDYSIQDYVAYQNRLEEFVHPYIEAFDILREMNIHVFSGSHVSRLNQYILYTDVRYLLNEGKI